MLAIACRFKSGLRYHIYRVIDQQTLMELLNNTQYGQWQQHHKDQVEIMLASVHHNRDPRWSSSIAVGSREYVDSIKVALGISGKYKHTVEKNGTCVLQEPQVLYTQLFIPEKATLIHIFCCFSGL